MREAAFMAWYQDVFDGRHALVPDIKNSESWTEKLVLAQRKVLGSQGVQGGGLAVALRSLSFAKQRFESLATPQLQMCCLYQAVALMLAVQAADIRNDSDTRQRARAALQRMPGQVLTTGLAATYSAEALDFVRVFDVRDHDPAATWRQYQRWRAGMHNLFLEGHVFALPREGEGETPLQIILSQVRAAPPIFYGDRVVHLHSEPTPEERDRVTKGMQNIVHLVLRRLDAVLHVDCPEVGFTGLDLRRWRKALSDNAVGDGGHWGTLQSHCRSMFRQWKLDPCQGVRELDACARHLAPPDEADPQFDNRATWRKIFEPEVAGRISANPLAVLPTLVRIYLCAMDGTGQVERDLGSLANLLGKHSGPMDEDGVLASALVEVLVDGPQTESDLATRREVHTDALDPDIFLEPTAFTRRCAELWVAKHGRRFALYKTRAATPRPPRVGTLASVLRSASVARLALATRPQRGATTDREQTILGVPRRDLVASPLDVANLSERSQQFAQLTAAKRQELKAMSEARADTRKRSTNPYAVESLNPTKKLRTGPLAQTAPAPGPAAGLDLSRRVKVLDLSSVAVAPLLGVRCYLVRATEARQYFESMKRADVVIMDSPWSVDKVAGDTANGLKVHLLAMGLGVRVLPTSSWNGATPFTSSSMVRFKRMVAELKVAFEVSHAFRQQHPHFMQMFRQCAALPGSKWSVMELPPAPIGVAGGPGGAAAKAGAKAAPKAGAQPRPKAKAKAATKAVPKAAAVSSQELRVRIENLEHVRSFVQTHRRFQRSSDVSCAHL